MMRTTRSCSERSGVGDDLVRVTDRARCPVCDRAKLCRVTRDGAEVWCSRVADGAAAVTHNALGDVYIHRSDDVRWAGARDVPRVAPPTGVAARAPLDVLDRGYRIVLSRLSLDDSDGDALRRRGLTVEDITRGTYRTLPQRGRAALALALVDELGAEHARGIPGVVWRSDPADPSRGWWSFGGAPGLVVPCRDDRGRVTALKIRRRDPCDGPRYLYVSSSSAGGPSALTTVHVPLLALDLRASRRLVITEGELKADVATTLLRTPVLSVPGVGAWRAGVEAVRAWDARIVAVAFDADARVNPVVARHTRALLTALAARGIDARLWQWPAEAGKGLDDVLALRRDGRDGDDALA